MPVVGIVCEFDPFHQGHQYLIQKIREKAGKGTGIICVMSGDVTQRGEFSTFDKWTRAEAAVKNGADLVIELSPAYACQTARFFAQGALEALKDTGLVTHLGFGIESDPEIVQKIEEMVRYEMTDGFKDELETELKKIQSYPAARQSVMVGKFGQTAETLSQPNMILAYEYIHACEQMKTGISYVPVQRIGAGHHGDHEEGYASGSFIRKMIMDGNTEKAKEYLPENCFELVERDLNEGRISFGLENSKAVLYLLKKADSHDFNALPDTNDEIASRYYTAARKASSVGEFISMAKARNLPESRVRRAVLHLATGITKEVVLEKSEYIRVLAFSEQGRSLIKEIKTKGIKPIITNTRNCSDDEEVRSQMLLAQKIHDLRLLTTLSENAFLGEEWIRHANPFENIG